MAPSPPGSRVVNKSSATSSEKCSVNSSASWSGGTSASPGVPFAIRIRLKVSRGTATPTVITGFGASNKPESSSSSHQETTAIPAAARPNRYTSSPAAFLADASELDNPAMAVLRGLDMMATKL